MTDKQNYNYLAAAGKINIDDKEVCEDLGLDPGLAYTKDLNKAALDATMAKLRVNLEGQGYTPEETHTYMQNARNEVLRNIKAAEELSGRKLM